MHQNTFGRQALPGPAEGELKLRLPSCNMGLLIRDEKEWEEKGREGIGRDLYVTLSDATARHTKVHCLMKLIYDISKSLSDMSQSVINNLELATVMNINNDLYQ